MNEFINKIHLGDCREIMAKMPENSVEMVITSPPYNVGKDYGSTWDDNMAYDEYWKFTQEWITQSYRVLVDGGRIAINIPVLGNNPNTPKSQKYLPFLPDYINCLSKAGFTIREIVTWIKATDETMSIFCMGSTAWGSFLSPSNPYMRSFIEYIIVAYKDNPSLVGNKDKIDITKEEFMVWSKNAWYFMTESDRSHPAPFPEELPRRLLKFYSYQGNTVLDPFSGTGTTCKVAKDLKRNYVGIDISEQYCERARNRCNQESFSFMEEAKNTPKISQKRDVVAYEISEKNKDNEIIVSRGDEEIKLEKGSIVYLGEAK